MAPAAPPAAEAGRSRAPAYAVLGIGAVGLGVGTVFGILALGKKSDLDSACANKHCAPAQQDTIDSGKTFGIVSTVGLAVGAVGVGVGAVLLLTSGPGSPSARAGKPARQAGLSVAPVIGTDRVGLSGTF